MYLEQRLYTLVPGGPPQYLKAYNAGARQLQSAILGNLVGLYVSESGELNQVMFLWGFESLDERGRRRRQLMADPEFAKFREATRHLLVKQESRIFNVA